MADNVPITSGIGTSIATDEIGGVHVQRIKVQHGAEGSATDTSAAAPFPVAPISGQVGVAAGAGAVNALTQRATLASDDPAVAALGAVADAAATQGSTGSISAKLRTVTAQLNTLAGHLDGVETALAGLALESGGNLAALAASASVLDDWDESDRAKVNPIAGQAGVAAGAGSISALTQRVTIATDDTVATDLTAIRTAAQLLDDNRFADDAAFTVGTSKVGAVGFLADESATDSVDEGDVGAARMTLDRKVQTVNEIESSSMRISGVAVGPKFAVIDVASSGDNTLISAVNPKKIRVLACFMVAAGAVNVRFESGASGTALTGQMNLAANGGFVLPFNPAGWFETASNTLLNLELSGAVSVDGSITYIEV